MCRASADFLSDHTLINAEASPGQQLEQALSVISDWNEKGGGLQATSGYSSNWYLNRFQAPSSG
jgi:uncharacterized membrane protein